VYRFWQEPGRIRFPENPDVVAATDPVSLGELWSQGILVSCYPYRMIAKKTVKNQITLPKKIAERFPDCNYFDVTAEADKIVLRPVDPAALTKVRQKLAELGIEERHVREAVEWARERSR